MTLDVQFHLHTVYMYMYIHFKYMYMYIHVKYMYVCLACLIRRVSSVSKAVSKPKSFLEIQQEQESDIHKQVVVSAMGTSLSGKAPQKPKVGGCQLVDRFDLCFLCTLCITS